MGMKKEAMVGWGTGGRWGGGEKGKDKENETDKEKKRGKRSKRHISFLFLFFCL